MAKKKMGCPESNYFQKGNQLAKGKGRPPVQFTDEEVHAIGQELLEWLDEAEEKGFWHISDFYWSKKRMLLQDWVELKNRLGFKSYYEAAVARMARLTMSNKEMHTSYGNRFLGMYSAELRQFERDVKRETIQDEVDIKVKAGVAVTESDQSMNSAIVQGISELQRAFKKDEMA